MAIHGWGQPVTIYQIAVELGIQAQGLSLGDGRVRNLLGNPTGAVYMSNAYGKSNGYSGTIAVGNRGVKSGVYRPDANSNWQYGSFSNPICLGAPIISMLWEVDRYDNASIGGLKLGWGVGNRLRITLNGRAWLTDPEYGTGGYSFAADMSQYLENTPSPVNITITVA